MSLPGWQVHVVPSLAPHPPQGCPGSSCPSPRGFVTTPGLQEEGSLPQPTPALGSQKEPKATQKPATKPTAAAPLWNRASTSHSSQIPRAKQRKTSKAKTSLTPQPGNAPAGGRQGGHRELGQLGRGVRKGVGSLVVGAALLREPLPGPGGGVSRDLCSRTFPSWRRDRRRHRRPLCAPQTP